MRIFISLSFLYCQYFYKAKDLCYTQCFICGNIRFEEYIFHFTRNHFFSFKSKRGLGSNF